LILRQNLRRFRRRWSRGGRLCPDSFRRRWRWCHRIRIAGRSGLFLRLIFRRCGGLRRLSLWRGRGDRGRLGLCRCVVGDKRAFIALEVDGAEHAQNQGEQGHQQQGCTPGSAGSRGGCSQLIQYSKIQTRPVMETLTWLKGKSRLVSHLAERFLVDDAERPRPGKVRACENPPPPMVFWRLRNQYRWGRVTGPYVSMTRRRFSETGSSRSLAQRGARV
jgi:hypothetical protein